MFLALDAGGGGGGAQTSGSRPSSGSSSPKARAMTSLDGVGGRPFAAASRSARSMSICCSQGMSRPAGGEARDSDSGLGVDGSRFSFFTTRAPGASPFAPSRGSSPHRALRWRPGRAPSSGSPFAGAGPLWTSHHAGSAAASSDRGGGNGSLSNPRTGSAEDSCDARSAALRCARSSVARSRACLRFCAQSAAALEAWEGGKGRWGWTSTTRSKAEDARRHCRGPRSERRGGRRLGVPLDRGRGPRGRGGGPAERGAPERRRARAARGSGRRRRRPPRVRAPLALQAAASRASDRPTRHG